MVLKEIGLEIFLFAFSDAVNCCHGLRQARSNHGVETLSRLLDGTIEVNKLKRWKLI